MPAYTVGTEQEYDDAMVRGVNGDGKLPIVKRGKYVQPDGTAYNGGYAFETPGLAFAFIVRNGKTGSWAVYEMNARWPDDVWKPHPEEDFWTLARDAILVRKAMTADGSVAAPAAPPAAPAATVQPASGPLSWLRRRFGW